MNTWILNNLEWLLALSVGVAVAALVLVVSMWQKFRQQRETLELLEVRFGTLQEQSQHDLLAMGQRVIEAEKSVRRFSDRIESLEASTPAAERYGQLGSLLAGKLLSGEESTASTAELELKSLMQRGKTE